MLRVASAVVLVVVCPALVATEWTLFKIIALLCTCLARLLLLLVTLLLSLRMLLLLLLLLQLAALLFLSLRAWLFFPISLMVALLVSTAGLLLSINV